MASQHGFQRVIQLFWDNKLSNSDHENNLVVLGRLYSPVPAQDDPEGTQEENTEKAPSRQESSMSDLRLYLPNFSFGGAATSLTKDNNAEWPHDFIEDVYTKIWLTYRTRFPPIYRDEDGPSPLSLQSVIRGQNYDLTNEYFTTDCGWGCMIRTSQSLLANTLLHLHIGRDWRFDERSDSKHEEIVSWFIDAPNHPFSIHKIVDMGRQLSNKKAGEWFGPSASARSLQALCNQFNGSNLKVYVGSDSGDIYENDLFKVSLSEEGEFLPVLILLGVRLGVDNVNKFYWESLKEILSSEESVGISGGRPSSSHYFFGYQGDYLFYLDPHLPQPALSDEQDIGNHAAGAAPSLDLESVHTKKLRKLHLSEVDPSMLLGFLIRDIKEWDAWKNKIQNPGHENKIVHIFPNDNPSRDFVNRKPSFVIYDEGGDDFVDVGLEYDLNEEDESEAAENIDQTWRDSSNLQQDVSSDHTKDETDASVVVITDLRKDSAVEALMSTSAETQNTAGSFINCNSSIKDEYENINETIENNGFELSTDANALRSDSEEPQIIDGTDQFLGSTIQVNKHI